MNKIFKQLTSLTAPKSIRPKRTTPVILCIDINGYCLGKLEGNDIKAAFEMFPNATVLNIIPVRGRTMVITKQH